MVGWGGRGSTSGKRAARFNFNPDVKYTQQCPESYTDQCSWKEMADTPLGVKPHTLLAASSVLMGSQIRRLGWWPMGADWGKQCDRVYIAEWKRIISSADRACLTRLTSSANTSDTHTLSHTGTALHPPPAELYPQPTLNVTSSMQWLLLPQINTRNSTVVYAFLGFLMPGPRFTPLLEVISAFLPLHAVLSLSQHISRTGCFKISQRGAEGEDARQIEGIYEELISGQIQNKSQSLTQSQGGGGGGGRPLCVCADGLMLISQCDPVTDLQHTLSRSGLRLI